MVYSIQRRLKLINVCLKIDGFTTDDVLKSVENKPFSIFKSYFNIKDNVTPRTVVNVIDALGKQQKITDIFFIENGKSQLYKYTVCKYSYTSLYGISPQRPL